MGLKQDLQEVYKVSVHPFLLRADSCVTNFRVERHLWIHFQFVGRTPAFLNASLFEENGCSLLCVHLWFGKWAFLGIKMGKVRICKCEGGNAPHSALLPRADGCMPREAPQRPAAAIFAVQMQAHLQIRAAHLQMRPAHHSAFVNARVHLLIL